MVVILWQSALMVMGQCPCKVGQSHGFHDAREFGLNACSRFFFYALHSREIILLSCATPEEGASLVAAHANIVAR